MCRGGCKVEAVALALTAYFPEACMLSRLAVRAPIPSEKLILFVLSACWDGDLNGRISREQNGHPAGGLVSNL